MEFFLLLLIIGLIFLLKNSIDKNAQLNDEMLRTLNTIKNDIKNLMQNETEVVEKKSINETQFQPLYQPTILPKKEVGEEVLPKTETKKEPINPTISKGTYFETSLKPKFSVEETSLNWWDKFIKNNPDIEKFIGENLVNKIGIVVLVLGIAFFVKYAIDKDWIKEIGRVAVGLGCGALLIGIAHKLRQKYRAFSSVLVGGGLTVFYFTIGFAFHNYAIFNQTQAFILMVCITAFAIALSVWYNRIELAIIATIGGFVTPFIVTTGNNNFIALFTYLSILNVGLIVLSYFKEWRVLQFIAFAFTSLIFGAWMYERLDATEFNTRWAIFFASLFYILFVCMTLMHHLVKKHKLLATDFTLFLSVNLFFLLAGINILDTISTTNYKGIFVFILALLNGLLLLISKRTKGVDANLITLILGLAVSYFTLTIPIQFNGNVITIFWAAEMVLLLWLYQKTNISLLKFFFLITSIVLVVSLMKYWVDAYSSNTQTIPIVLNKVLLTALFTTICFYIAYQKLIIEANSIFLDSISTATVRTIYLVILVVVAYLSGLLEINHQFITHLPKTKLNYLYTVLYTSLFTITSIKWLRSRLDNLLVYLFYSSLGIILFILFSNVIYIAYINVLQQNLGIVYWLSYFITAAVAVLLLLKLVNYLRLQEQNNNSQILTTILFLLFVIVFSLVCLHAYILIEYKHNNLSHLENIYQKAGLSIVWGILSFISMWLGMKHKFKFLRILALLLFGITLLKLFLIDIKHMNEAGKIIAFILLGALLLIISFMYQRLKKILVDEN
jgi:uncharacterized membrane protein